MAKETVNTFNQGMVKDVPDMQAPATVYTDALNATLISGNGNEYIMQNDYGNAKIFNSSSESTLKYVELSPGFIPVGGVENRGIYYIASWNPITNEGELGTYPSPRYEQSELVACFNWRDFKLQLDSNHKLIPSFQKESDSQWIETVKNVFNNINSDKSNKYWELLTGGILEEENTNYLYFKVGKQYTNTLLFESKSDGFNNPAKVLVGDYFQLKGIENEYGYNSSNESIILINIEGKSNFTGKLQMSVNQDNDGTPGLVLQELKPLSKNVQKIETNGIITTSIQFGNNSLNKVSKQNNIEISNVSISWQYQYFYITEQEFYPHLGILIGNIQDDFPIENSTKILQLKIWFNKPKEIESVIWEKILNNLNNFTGLQRPLSNGSSVWDLTTPDSSLYINLQNIYKILKTDLQDNRELTSENVIKSILDNAIFYFYLKYSDNFNQYKIKNSIRKDAIDNIISEDINLIPINTYIPVANKLNIQNFNNEHLPITVNTWRYKYLENAMLLDFDILLGGHYDSVEFFLTGELLESPLDKYHLKYIGEKPKFPLNGLEEKQFIPINYTKAVEDTSFRYCQIIEINILKEFDPIVYTTEIYNIFKAKDKLADIKIDQTSKPGYVQYYVQSNYYFTKEELKEQIASSTYSFYDISSLPIYEDLKTIIDAFTYSTFIYEYSTNKINFGFSENLNNNKPIYYKDLENIYYTKRLKASGPYSFPDDSLKYDRYDYDSTRDRIDIIDFYNYLVTGYVNYEHLQNYVSKYSNYGVHWYINPSNRQNTVLHGLGSPVHEDQMFLQSQWKGRLFPSNETRYSGIKTLSSISATITDKELSLGNNQYQTIKYYSKIQGSTIEKYIKAFINQQIKVKIEETNFTLNTYCILPKESKLNTISNENAYKIYPIQDNINNIINNAIQVTDFKDSFKITLKEQLINNLKGPQILFAIFKATLGNKSKYSTLPIFLGSYLNKYWNTVSNYYSNYTDIFEDSSQEISKQLRNQYFLNTIEYKANIIPGEISQNQVNNCIIKFTPEYKKSFGIPFKDLDQNYIIKDIKLPLMFENITPNIDKNTFTINLTKDYYTAVFQNDSIKNYQVKDIQNLNFLTQVDIYNYKSNIDLYKEEDLSYVKPSELEEKDVNTFRGILSKVLNYYGDLQDLGDYTWIPIKINDSKNLYEEWYGSFTFKVLRGINLHNLYIKDQNLQEKPLIWQWHSNEIIYVYPIVSEGVFQNPKIGKVITLLKDSKYVDFLIPENLSYWSENKENSEKLINITLNDWPSGDIFNLNLQQNSFNDYTKLIENILNKQLNTNSDSTSISHYIPQDEVTLVPEGEFKQYSILEPVYNSLVENITTYKDWFGTEVEFPKVNNITNFYGEAFQYLQYEDNNLIIQNSPNIKYNTTRSQNPLEAIYWHINDPGSYQVLSVLADDGIYFSIQFMLDNFKFNFTDEETFNLEYYCLIRNFLISYSEYNNGNCDVKYIFNNYILGNNINLDEHYQNSIINNLSKSLENNILNPIKNYISKDLRGGTSYFGEFYLLNTTNLIIQLVDSKTKNNYNDYKITPDISIKDIYEETSKDKIDSPIIYMISNKDYTSYPIETLNEKLSQGYGSSHIECCYVIKNLNIC